jgi:hypothetical protein
LNVALACLSIAAAPGIAGSVLTIFPNFCRPGRTAARDRKILGHPACAALQIFRSIRSPECGLIELVGAILFHDRPVHAAGGCILLGSTAVVSFMVRAGSNAYPVLNGASSPNLTASPFCLSSSWARGRGGFE